MANFRLETDRLILRDWRDEDVDDFHRLDSDPEVMKTLGPLLSREQSAALIARLQDHAAATGHTLWALERKDDGRVIGWTGLIRSKVPQVAGELEIGWRLASDCWRQGFAREAAEASLGWAGVNCPSEKVIAFTAVINNRSRVLMERLGMSYCPKRDFDHPNISEGDPLRSHVVYEKDLPA